MKSLLRLVGEPGIQHRCTKSPQSSNLYPSNLAIASHPLKRLRVNSQERSRLQTIEQSLKIDPFIVGRLNFGMGG